MKGIEDTKTKLPELKNHGRMHVYLQGNYFQQNNVIIPNNNNIINIFVVYKLDPKVQLLIILFKMLYLVL